MGCTSSKTGEELYNLGVENMGDATTGANFSNSKPRIEASDYVANPNSGSVVVGIAKARRPSIGSIFGELVESQPESDVLINSFGNFKLITPDSQLHPQLGLRYGHCEDIGGRETMEDAACQIHDHEGFAFYGVFDGHGGDKTSRFIAKHLHEKLASTFPLSGGRSSVKTAIENACAQVDDDFLEEGIGDDSGSTAIFMIYYGGRKVAIGCVGDSCAILSSSATAEVLSVEHKPDVPSEKKRILAANGKVAQGRVFGVLGVSRAFGDRDLKTSRGRFTKKFNGDVVICAPDIAFRDLLPNDEFIVLACDGLLDVMKPQQVVSFVRERLEAHGDVQKASEELVQRATKRLGSKDNVTATIVCFPPHKT